MKNHQFGGWIFINIHSAALASWILPRHRVYRIKNGVMINEGRRYRISFVMVEMMMENVLHSVGRKTSISLRARRYLRT